MFLFDKLCKENEWTLIQNLAQKKEETDHPPKHLFSAQEIDPLTAKVRAKKPPSPGSEWIWFDRLWESHGPHTFFDLGPNGKLFVHDMYHFSWKEKLQIP